MQILDTNCLLRFFRNDIPAQAEEVEKLLVSASEGKTKVHIPLLVVSELIFTLHKHYQWDKPTLGKKILSFVNLKYIDFESQATLTTALEIYQTKNLHFVDSYLLALSHLHSHQLFTFDQKLSHSTKSTK